MLYFVVVTRIVSVPTSVHSSKVLGLNLKEICESFFAVLVSSQCSQHDNQPILFCTERLLCQSIWSFSCDDVEVIYPFLEALLGVFTSIT